MTSNQLLIRAALITSLYVGSAICQEPVGGDPATSTFKVYVWTKERPNAALEGTAFVIDSTGECDNPTLYFLTAAHVILGPKAKDNTKKEDTVDHVEIRFNNSSGGTWPIDLDAIWIPANWESTGKDFAILKVISAGKRILPVKLQLTSAGSGFKDKSFKAFGFPPEFTRIVTVDGRVIDDAPGNSHPKPWLLVTSGFTPGMSGGPIATGDTVFATVQGRTEASAELKFVIPISQASSFIRDIVPNYPSFKCGGVVQRGSKQVVKLALLLNGEVYYTREVLEVVISRLREALAPTEYTPIFEYAVGSPETSKAPDNERVLKSLLDRFQDGKPDYLVTVGTAVSEVASKVYLNKIPIVFVAVTDPVRSKLVRTFDPDPARGKIAGVVYGVPLNVFLGFFQRAFPSKRFGFIYNTIYPQDIAFKEQVMATAPTLIPPMKVVPIQVTEPRLSIQQQQQADIFFGRFFLMDKLQQFITSSKKPFVAGDISNVYKGALACINTDSKELARIAVDEIILPNLLKGKALSDLQVFYPNHVITGLNLRAARQYGISVSPLAIEEAQEVVR